VEPPCEAAAELVEEVADEALLEETAFDELPSEDDEETLLSAAEEFCSDEDEAFPPKAPLIWAPIITTAIASAIAITQTIIKLVRLPLTSFVSFRLFLFSAIIIYLHFLRSIKQPKKNFTFYYLSF
jgi:hypothetical protein